MTREEVIACFLVARKPKMTKRTFRRYRATFSAFDVAYAKAQAARWAASVVWE